MSRRRNYGEVPALVPLMWLNDYIWRLATAWTETALLSTEAKSCERIKQLGKAFPDA